MKKIILLFILLLSFNLGYTNKDEYIKIFDINHNEFFFKTEVDKIHFNINIENDNTEYKMFFYDIYGRKIIEKDIECSITFTKNGISKGLYVIRITDGKNNFTKKIIIS